MKVTRKFNLSRIGKQYESVSIEAEGESLVEIIAHIDSAWKEYKHAIESGQVE